MVGKYNKSDLSQLSYELKSEKYDCLKGALNEIKEYLEDDNKVDRLEILKIIEKVLECEQEYNVNVLK